MSRWRVRSGHAWEPWLTPNRSQARSLLPICFVAVLYAVCEGGIPNAIMLVDRGGRPYHMLNGKRNVQTEPTETVELR